MKGPLNAKAGRRTGGIDATAAHVAAALPPKAVHALDMKLKTFPVKSSAEGSDLLNMTTFSERKKDGAPHPKASQAMRGC